MWNIFLTGLVFVAEFTLCLSIANPALYILLCDWHRDSSVPAGSVLGSAGRGCQREIWRWAEGQGGFLSAFLFPSAWLQRQHWLQPSSLKQQKFQAKCPLFRGMDVSSLEPFLKHLVLAASLCFLLLYSLLSHGSASLQLLSLILVLHSFAALSVFQHLGNQFLF